MSESVTAARPGRPKRSPQDLLEGAAEELFLEQGYHATSIDQIVRRAGVGRGTFFNYFTSKSDLLWTDADRVIAEFAAELRRGTALLPALRAVVNTVGADSVPLALAQSEVMGTESELIASGLSRGATLSALIAGALRDSVSGQPRSSCDEFTIAITANAVTGALIAAWASWARAGLDRRSLVAHVEDALALVERGVAGLLR